MFMTYLMSYVLYLIHLMYFSLMLGRVMLTCDSFALIGWTSTPKGGLTTQRDVDHLVPLAKNGISIEEFRDFEGPALNLLEGNADTVCFLHAATSSRQVLYPGSKAAARTG